MFRKFSSFVTGFTEKSIAILGFIYKVFNNIFCHFNHVKCVGCGSVAKLMNLLEAESTDKMVAGLGVVTDMNILLFLHTLSSNLLSRYSGVVIESL